MTHFETGYQPLHSYHDNGEETPQDAGVMIHVVPESSKARWNHIDDLDSFFTRVYHYHQKHGFSCMMLQEILELAQFAFVVIFSTFLLNCVDYSVLFHDKNPNQAPAQNYTTHKVTIRDAVIPIQQCAENLSGVIIVSILVAVAFWILRIIKVVFHFYHFIEIKSFYSTALKINESDLDNMTWHEVQRRMQEVQLEQQMCIHKKELTELDIYHRILRFKNYTVAMVNKSLLPLKFRVPFMGEVVFFTKGLKYNLELILFWGPWAPFENNWHLKEDFKKISKRKDLAENLSKHILWIGIANFLLCPLILLWQILYFFFNYAEVIKREPGSLGARRWSLYGRLYLRHFNELDHELNARLNRAYKAATRYMNIFTSHILVVIAKNIAFFTGSLLAVLVILTVIDEDVLQVEHVLTIITVLGMIVAGCRVFIPDEHLVWSPEKLMMSILAHVHYMPDSWKGNAHTTKVRDEFAQLFQYKAVHLLEELFSPIITPFILCFRLRHKSLDIVDFYRNFTVDVIGVGDVCSFAQMDVRKHGNPQWMQEVQSEATQYLQAEDGKTELSLMHFTVTNPGWKPPENSNAFITQLRAHAHKDAERLHVLHEENPLYYSLHSLSSLGVCYSHLINSAVHASSHQASTSTGVDAATLSEIPHTLFPVLKGGINKAEGPAYNTNTGLLSSVHPELFSHCNVSQSIMSTQQNISVDNGNQLLEQAAVEMSINTLYMHELHHRRVLQRVNYIDPQERLWQRPGVDMPNIDESPHEEDRTEKAPLLEPRISRSS